MAYVRRLLVVLATAVPILLIADADADAATISSSTPTPLADDFADNAECSLREMVAIANSNNASIEDACTVTNAPAADTIQLGSGTYVLSRPIDGTPDINDGDLETNDGFGLTVTGAGAGATTIDGSDLDRIFEVAFGAPLTLNGLTVSNGTSAGAAGGGISSASELTLQNARVTNNLASAASGGGIAMNGAGLTLTLTDTTIDTNVSGVAGGGVNLVGSASLTTSGATAINGNTAALQGGGINNGGPGSITLNTAATVNGNHGGSVGGGVASNGDGDVTVAGATVNGNDAVAGTSGQGGGVYFVGSSGDQLELTDAKVQNNSVSGVTAAAAGVFGSVGNGTGTITRTLISGNTMTIADNGVDGLVHGGSGVSVGGTGQTTITDSRLLGNTITVNDPQDFGVGAGINDMGTLTVERTTLDNNAITGGSGRAGGALNVSQVATGPAKVINSTFSGNSIGTTEPATTSGGAIFAPTASAALTVAQSTFTGNTAPSGSSLGLTGTSYTIRGSVFHDGLNACVPNTLTGVDGYNVDEGTSCVGVTDDTDRENTSATLGALLPNGGPLYGMAGPTLTHALTGPGPVLNLVPPASCEDLAGGDLLVDQRGAPRPTDGGCEPGAYELISCFAQPAFVGSAGDDAIDAVSFPDTDTFHGLNGSDTITGDGDANRLCGGDGGDTISARDGVADQIDCGAGTDSAQTDPLTVDSVVNCESVDTGESTTPPTTPPPPTTATGQRAAALKKCKKKPKGPKRKKCIKKAKRLPL